jgi:D-arginine dehydrogenase
MAELELLLASGSSVSEISPEDAVARVPILSRADVHRAVIDESGEDVDVDALHQAWLKRLRQLNGEIICGAPVTKLSQADCGGDVETEIQKYHTPIIVNAAGAWAGRSPYCRHLTGLTSLTGRCSVTPLRRGTPSLKPAS